MINKAQSLSSHVALLKSKATRHAVSGVVIASTGIVLASILSAYAMTGQITFDSILYAQKNNVVLWFLDTMPFIFAFWGQYVSSMMAYEAGAILMDETNELRMQSEVVERKALHDSTHDSLTDLPNRILFVDRLSQAVHIAHRENLTLAVLIFDLDRFKEINDTLGHYNGDRILKQVALRLSGVTRESDTLARLGGDEFGILLPKIKHIEDMQKVVQKIQKTLDPPFSLENLALDVKASIGCSLYPVHGRDADTLLQRADIAMYVAKQNNSGFMLYSEELDQHSPHRLTLMGELREAMDQDHLIVYYQPKVNTVDNTLAGVECLVRWLHKKHGMMPPDEFIPLAERTGLITNLTMWVLKKSLEQCALWHNDGIKISVSVNISAKNLLDPEFPEIITGLLAAYDFSSNYLILEITETTIMTDPERSLEVLKRLSDIGIEISIDDFGTGYSSLSYLKKMPASELKIDRSFVDDMLDNESDAVIVRTTIDLGHNLGMKVVAEGVENKEVMDKLTSLHCDILQGYYLGKPLPAGEFNEWLKLGKFLPQ